MSPATQQSMTSAASTRAELDLDSQTRMVRALRERLAERHGGPVALLDTQIS